MSIAEIAEQSIPFALNLTAKFRSTQIRTGVLISGPSGWGEFAPFPEYRDEICSKWLAGALESAFGTFPAKLRSSVPVNSIIPMLSVEQTISTVEAAVTNYGMTTFKVKVADSTPESLASDELRVKAVRSTLDRLGIEGKMRRHMVKKGEFRMSFENQDVEIGSYPFFQAGKLGVSIVIRSEDQKKIDKCSTEILEFVNQKKIEVVIR